MLEILSHYVFIPLTELVILCGMLASAIPLVHYPARGLAWLLRALLGVRVSGTVRWVSGSLLGLVLVGLVIWAAVPTWALLVPLFRSVGRALADWAAHPLAPLVWLLLVLGLVGLVVWLRTRHEPARVLRRRYVRPIREWFEDKCRAVVALGRVPVLGRLIRELEGLLSQVQEHRCQTGLGYLFFLSIFTIPVQVFPWLDSVFDALIGQPVVWLLGEVPWLPAQNVALLGHFFLLVFDWALLIVFFYAVVFGLSLLFRKDRFASVDEAVRYYVVDLEAFSFAAYFRWDENTPATASVRKGAEATQKQWQEFASRLHAETENLDESLWPTWQGENSRVAVVFEGEVDGTAEVLCIHYRRVGKAGFVVAIDRERPRPDGQRADRQADFRGLTASIGRLINVRESLK
jgi:hypothetical protein